MRKTFLLFFATFFAVAALASCDLLDDDEEPKPSSSSSSGVCSGSYKSPTKDGQLDAFCGAAYAYRCLDGKALSNAQVQSVCSSYNQIKTSSAPSCGYCN
ncbi:hypothetical protein KXQ82_00110 [Mucilaginibacter sp. HMF5004]|uniref:hypothetical protein n=1 Tax=Mucilaginibacter rivuli TaxID=2857527 RepID=UPI001C5D6EC0|nr:hypothetical protein [Mucilaginibacter rivuli]MBW4888088.1 hypothetical protein [Mucilaginibacter rivuli]